MSSKVAKWERWLDQIKQQMYTLMWSRFIFNETFEVIRANESLPKRNSFYRALKLWYADSILMGIRRQLKSSDRSISLVRVLAEIRDQPGLLNRKRWRQLHQGFSLIDWADQSFDRFAEGRHSPDPAMVDADLVKLRKLGAKCETFIDKRVAHHDRGADPKTPTYDEANAALDELDRVFQKYYLIVTANNAMTLPNIAYNWRAVFQQRWMPPVP